VSNGEYNPIPQTEDQAKVESLIKEMGDNQAKRHGMDHGSFLATSAGMATAFLAMNKVFGPIFDVSEDEAGDMEMSDYRASQLSNQFIFDDQTHFGRAVRRSILVAAFQLHNPERVPRSEQNGRVHEVRLHPLVD